MAVHSGKAGISISVHSKKADGETLPEVTGSALVSDD